MTTSCGVCAPFHQHSLKNGSTGHKYDYYVWYYDDFIALSAHVPAHANMHRYVRTFTDTCQKVLVHICVHIGVISLAYISKRIDMWTIVDPLVIGTWWHGQSRWRPAGRGRLGASARSSGSRRKNCQWVGTSQLHKDESPAIKLHKDESYIRIIGATWGLSIG